MRHTLFLFLLALPGLLSAQSRFSVDLNGGVNYSHGDISSTFTPNADLGIKYGLSDQLALSANFRKGWLSDDGNDQSGREFTNDFFAYGISAHLNVSKLANLLSTFEKTAIILHGGVNLLHSNATDDASYPAAVSPRPDYTGVDLVYPLGGTLKFYLSKKLDLNLSYIFTKTSSDDIDNFNADVIGNRFVDGISTASIGISYKISGKNNRIRDKEDHLEWKSDDAVSRIEQVEDRNKRKVNDLEERLDNTEALLDSVRLVAWENQAQIMEMKKTIASQRDTIVSIMKQQTGTSAGAPVASGSTTSSSNDNQKEVNTKGSSRYFAGNHFVLVIGSFRTEARAEAYAKEAKQKGMNPGIAYSYERKWYYVYGPTFADEDDARKALLDLRKKYDDAWMYFRSYDDIEMFK